MVARLIFGIRSSGQAAPRRDPALGLPGDRSYVLEVGVVVQDNSAVVLSDRRRDQVDDARCPVVPASGHPDLNVPGALGDHRCHRQHDVQALASLRDNLDISKIAAGVTGFQIVSGLWGQKPRRGC